MVTQFIDNKDYKWNCIKSKTIQISFKGHFIFGAIFYDADRAAKKLLDLITSITGEEKELREIIDALDGNYAFYFENETLSFAVVDKIKSYSIFYHEKNGRTIFSNSIYSIIKSENIQMELDNESVNIFTTSGYTIGRSTLLNSVMQLQAGEYILINKASKKQKRCDHYLFYEKEKTNASEEELSELLEQINLNIFEKLIMTLKGRQVIIPLSGGLDSKVILTYLLKLGYDNIKTYTYGIEGLWEVRAAEYIASICKVKWKYIKFDRKELKNIFHQEERKKYYKYASGLNTTPNMSGYYAHNLLRGTGYIDNDAVIINGQTGDFISGGHIPKVTNTQNNRLNNSLLTELIINKHFSLWKNQLVTSNHELLSNKICEGLGLDLSKNLSYQEFSDYFELFEWRERQSKFLVNGSRMYEWYGYDWRLPLWDTEYLNFWRQVPWEYKFNQKLYKNLLTGNNSFKLFDIDFPKKNSYPFAVRSLYFMSGVINKLSGDKFLGLNNFLKYYSQYGPYYFHKTFLSFTYTALNHRNAVSYWSRQLLKEIHSER